MVKLGVPLKLTVPEMSLIPNGEIVMLIVYQVSFEKCTYKIMLVSVSHHAFKLQSPLQDPDKVMYISNNCQDFQGFQGISNDFWGFHKIFDDFHLLLDFSFNI